MGYHCYLQQLYLNGNTIWTRQCNSVNNIGSASSLKIDGEGNFYCDAPTLKSLNDNNQVLFRYCNEAGELTPESNPNGALDAIAGICNKGRNVFGMMPHPERASEQVLGNTNGRLIFESILNMVQA